MKESLSLQNGSLQEFLSFLEPNFLASQPLHLQNSPSAWDGDRLVFEVPTPPPVSLHPQAQVTRVLCYKLDTNLSSHVGFANIFSQSVNCLFTFLMGSFEAEMFLILMKSNPSVFPLALRLVVSHLRNLLLHPQNHLDLLLFFLLRCVVCVCPVGRAEG